MTAIAAAISASGGPGKYRAPGITRRTDAPTGVGTRH